ncbi:MAG: protein kinase [Phycisphaerae bacterium]
MSEAFDAQVKRIFDDLIDEDGPARASFLKRACAGAPALQERVERLLAAAEKDDRFLCDPTFHLADCNSTNEIEEQTGEQIGNYRLIELIGEGGFGTVFLAEQFTPVQREVALKIIKAGMDTRQVIARFEAERRALALMDHPNIARVLEAGATTSGRPYFVMELVRGAPITRYCDAHRLSLKQRLELFCEICDAVQHAHQKGIVHRDLKPSNILVTKTNGTPVAKVIDFGVSKAIGGRLADHSLTEAHQLIGTPAYMSPEQADLSGIDVDTRSDIYSLGVLLYELLTGTTPFAQERLADSGLDRMRWIIRNEEPQRPSIRLRMEARTNARDSSDASSLAELPAQGLPGGVHSNSSLITDIAFHRSCEPSALVRSLQRDLDWIVLKCLEKDPERRYETASALADDVARFLEHQPVRATPPSKRYKLKKFVRRNRVAVIAGASVACALLLGTIGTTIGLVMAVAQQRRAEAQSAIATNEASQSRAINDFMREVFTSVEAQKRGADVRLVDVLAGASDSASQRFAGHPLLEAEVRRLLGEIYNNLGSWQRSVHEYQREAALFRDFAGIDDRRTLSAEHRLMAALLSLHKTAEAERVLAGLLPRMKRVFAADELLMLDTRRCEAVIHYLRGRLDDAEDILLDLRSHPQLIENDYLQLRLLNTLNLVYTARPRNADARLQAAHWNEVAALGAERVERAVRLYGPRSPATADARISLARALYYQGEYAASARECRAVLAETAEILGECHDFRADAMVDLATALGRLGMVREPAELYLRALECRRANYPPDSIPILSILSDALPYLARGGVSEEGLSIARDVTSQLRNFGGGHDDMLVTAEMYAALFESMVGDHDNAELHFEPLLLAESSIASTYTKARLQLCYGLHLLNCGEFEQAEQQLDHAVALRGDACRGTWPHLPDDLVLAYIALYEAWQQPEKLCKYQLLRETCFGIAEETTEN